MARCYQLSASQTADWDEGHWLQIRLLDDIVEWAERYAPHEPVVIVTDQHRLVGALTAEGRWT